MRVAALGDSITEGYMCHPEENWVSITRRELAITMYNLGNCGDLTRNMLNRFSQQVLRLSPSHCIILGGTNDAFCDVPQTDYGDNIDRIAGSCQENGIIPILGMPTPCLSPSEEFILQEYRDWLREYSLSKKIMSIDFYSVLLDTASMTGKQEYFLDDVHPNKAGYRVMAEAAKKILSSLLF